MSTFKQQKQPFRGVPIVKGVLKICSKFSGEHPCRSVISIKFRSNFIEITTSAWVFSCKFAAFFRTPFTKNTSGWLLLKQFITWKRTLSRKHHGANYQTNLSKTFHFPSYLFENQLQMILLAYFVIISTSLFKQISINQ